MVFLGGDRAGHHRGMFRRHRAERLGPPLHSKEVGCEVLIDAATRAGLSPDVCVRALGPVQIRGKAQVIEIYSPTR